MWRLTLIATLCSGANWEGTSGNSAVWRGETGERVQRRRQSRWGEKDISIIKEETLGSVLRPTSWRLCPVPTQSHLSKRPWTQSAARLFCFQTTGHKRPHRGHHSSRRKGVRLHLELATELASIIHVTLVCRHPKCKSQRTVESFTTSLVAGNVDRVPHKEAPRDHCVKQAQWKPTLQWRPLQVRWRCREHETPPRKATGEERSRLRREDTCATGGRAVGGLPKGRWKLNDYEFQMLAAEMQVCCFPVGFQLALG